MLQSIAVCCRVLQGVVECCRKLQHDAAWCSVLQRVAHTLAHTHTNTTTDIYIYLCRVLWFHNRALYFCRSVLCIAIREACISVNDCWELYCKHYNKLEHIAIFTLHHIATGLYFWQQEARTRAPEARACQPLVYSKQSNTHCNKLQQTATHCNTLQHSATQCNTLQKVASKASRLPLIK